MSDNAKKGVIVETPFGPAVLTVNDQWFLQFIDEDGNSNGHSKGAAVKVNGISGRLESTWIIKYESTNVYATNYLRLKRDGASFAEGLTYNADQKVRKTLLDWFTEWVESDEGKAALAIIETDNRNEAIARLKGLTEDAFTVANALVNFRHRMERKADGEICEFDYKTELSPIVGSVERSARVKLVRSTDLVDGKHRVGAIFAHEDIPAGWEKWR